MSIDTESFLFCGHFRHTVDGKFRISFPKAFRDLIPAEFSLRFRTHAGFDNVVEFHPYFSWKEHEMPELAALDRDDPDDRDRLRAKLSLMTDVVLDGASRILLPRYLLDYAGLTAGDECVFVGMGRFIELCSATTFDARVREYMGNFNKYASKKRAAGTGVGPAAKPGEPNG